MARVFVDVSLFGEGWFQVARRDFDTAPAVKLVYAGVEKLEKEHEKALSVKRYFKLMADRGRVEFLDFVEVQRHIDLLESHVVWRGEESCDDPHIFAIVFSRATPFVFSTDKRIAKCRGCLRGEVDSRYCRFVVISNERVYDRHKRQILA
jgi:hypothetical protein